MPTQHTIAQYMTRHPQTIGVDQVLALARRMMREHAVRHLPVLAAGLVVGVITERDLALAESARRLDLDRATVAQAMGRTAYCVSPEAALVDVVREMALCRHDAAVVLDGDQVVGIFTSVDALLALAHVLGARSGRTSPQVAAHG
jgi:acetoin utilization protein AcuB